MSSSSDDSSSSGYAMPSGYKPDAYAQNQAKGMGMTDAQYYAFQQAVGGSEYTPAGGQQGNQNYGANQGVSDQAYKIGALWNAIKSAGGGSGSGSGSSSQSTAAQSTARAPGPNDQLINIGAYVTGEKPVYNATPGEANVKSGIAYVKQPTTGEAIKDKPGGSWSTVPGLGMSASSVTDKSSPFYQPPPTQTGTLKPTAQTGGSDYVAGTPQATAPQVKKG